MPIRTACRFVHVAIISIYRISFAKYGYLLNKLNVSVVSTGIWLSLGNLSVFCYLTDVII